MYFNLKFVKISSNHRFAGVGFGGNIFIVLNALTQMNVNDTLYVDMETNECCCTEKDEFLFNTHNCWEYYFDQCEAPRGDVMRLNSLLSGNLSYSSSMFMFPDNFKEVREKFFNNFKLKTYLQESIDGFYNKNIAGKVTLGVQIRLTDMKQYHNVSSLEDYISKINLILSEDLSIEQIFLATDDNKAILSVIERVKVPVIYYSDMYRANDVELNLHPYDRFDVGKKLHRYNLGVDCIKEIITLSKCDYLLKAHTSAISMVACVLSKNIKKIYCV